jgi:hypothetical protein
MEVVDLAKDLNTAGPLARSNTPKLKFDKVLAEFVLFQNPGQRLGPRSSIES